LISLVGPPDNHNRTPGAEYTLIPRDAERTRPEWRHRAMIGIIIAKPMEPTSTILF
jgi:hypothetical protein